MTKSNDFTLEQIQLSLSDYQSELSAIDAEIDREKERILSAIQAEEAEIKSLLDRYRDIKRQKEIELVKTSYNNLSNFKKNLLQKIESEGKVANDKRSIAEAAQKFSDPIISDEKGGALKKTDEQPDEAEEVEWKDISELIDFIELTPVAELAKLYPADVSERVPFDVTDTAVKSQLLNHYQKHDPSIYNCLLKLYQKPNLGSSVEIPNVEKLSLKDRQYHDFLQANYPSSLPFFWFLINREPDSIRYVVMEFAVDHIIQTNTLENDPDRRELSLKLPQLLEMNNRATLPNFLRDLFISFHPQRVNPKSNARNKYFDYITNIIKTQATLEHSNVLQLWNYMKKSGYFSVSSADFMLIEPGNKNHTDSQTDSQNGHKNVALESQQDLL